MRKIVYLMVLIFAIKVKVLAQNGLEGLIIERYYLSNENDTTVNTVGGRLPVGSMTYRFYVDLLPGYKFQAAYGLPGHELRIATSTLFFNNEDRGDIYPSYSKNNAKDNTVMLDSWLSAGAACVNNYGVLKSEDNDNAATVVNAENPQVLQNDNILCGTPIKTKDGLQVGTPGVFGNIGIDSEIGVFGSQNDGTNGPVFSTTNGSWYCLGGSTGADSITNKVLIAQITTNGSLRYKLNIQIGTPQGGVERYVAEPLAGDSTSLLYSALNDSISPVSVKSQSNDKLCNHQIFPNPTQAGVIYLFSELTHSHPLTYTIYDSKGLFVKRSSSLSQSNTRTAIDTGDLSKGIYLLNFTCGDKQQTLKFIIN